MKKTFLTRAFSALLLGIFGASASAQMGPPPIITVQPLGVSVPNRGAAVLTVVAVSATSLSYKWYRNNSVVGGAHNSILTLNNANNGDAGTYRVEVKNASGMVVSSNAVVVVLPRVKKQHPIKAVKMKPTGFEIQLENLTDPQSVIYASTDLVNWTPIATNNVSAGSVTFTDTSAGSRPFRYYKAMDE